MTRTRPGFALIAALMVALILVAAAKTQPQFLPHRTHLTLPQKVTYYQRSIQKDETALQFLRSPIAPHTLQRVTDLRWYQAALHWHRQLLATAKAKLKPPRPTYTSLRAYAGPCLAQIIDREDPGWNPQRWNAQGSGAYGLPQALPGSKMASAGADWATNAYTQIRWMAGYVSSTYGGCWQALNHWNWAHSY